MEMIDRADIFSARLRAYLRSILGRPVYRPYNDAWRTIFVHIPKTGGMSIALTLFGERTRHAPYFEYERADREKFRTYFKFAFVRNPWDRVVSAYSYLRTADVNFSRAERQLRGFPNFESFVRGWLSPSKLRHHQHFLPQSYFVLDGSGRQMVDFVGRYEDIGRDFGVVAQRLGCSRELPHTNQSAHAQYAACYTDETRELVARLYARDIEAFGYTFVPARPADARP